MHYPRLHELDDGEDDRVKHMLLVHSIPEAFDNRDASSDDIQRTFAFMEQLNKELTDAGEMVDGAGLAGPAEARTVRKRDGKAVTLDGPFAETKEVIGGYWILECDRDRALEIATRVVDFDGPFSPDTIEVREISG